MRTVETDVMVVGAGPAGLTAAAFLAVHGVNALTISKHSGPASQPRAIHTNQRTMEVLRDLGIEDEVTSVGIPLKTLGNNVLATSLTGPEIFRYASYGTGARMADYAGASPCEVYSVPQHLLEPLLRKAGVERGADIRFSHELVEIEQFDDAVLSRVRVRDTHEEYQVRSRYVIGADGGRSLIAEKLGFGFEGKAALKHMLNMWVDVDLAEHTAYRPSVIYTILQPGSHSWVGAGMVGCIRPWNEWMLVREYDPSQGEPDTSDAAVTDFARTLVGDLELQLRVKGVYKWQVNNVVATEYRQGRVFLAGDAAHRHPPAGGLGSNTSIQDSYNLAWKLALVLSGHAGEGLLDSYDDERRPVGVQVVSRAVEGMENQGAAVAALGLRRGQSPEEGWASLNELASDTLRAAERRDELAAAVALQHYRTNAHGVELGQRYTSSVVVEEATPFPEPTRDPVLYYHPTTHSGAYLPHAWVERDRHMVSTLDLVGHGRFCLIVGIGGEPWSKAAATISAELGIELPVHSVGYRCDYDDVLGEWAALREIDDRGALLVRPDRHIAWRSHSRPDHPEDALRNAVQHALGLNRRPTSSGQVPDVSAPATR